MWLYIALTVCAYGFVDDRPVERPQLRDIYGVDHFYDAFTDEATKATVYVMLDEHCPVVKQQIPKLLALYKKYNGFERDRAGHPVDGPYRGDPVRFIGVYTTPDASGIQVADHALRSGIPFRVLRDLQLDFVRKFGVTRLSEVLVLDRDGKVLYQGPLDDQNFQGATRARANKRYLEEVLDHHLAGKEPPHRRIPPVGCKIETEFVSHESSLTFDDIAPILERRCASCHREGEVGPMPLTSYSDIRSYAGMIEEVVLEERMPPWPAKSPIPMRNKLALTTQEREMLLSWLRGGMKPGDPKRSMEVVSTESTESVAASSAAPAPWKIGEPDLVFEMPEPQKIPATGYLDYVYVPIAINGGKGFDEDRWISAIEVRPGAAEVVHHIQVHEFHGPPPKGKLDPIQQLLHYGLSVENARLIGSYTPGNLEENARLYSNYTDRPGTVAGMKLHRGSNLMLEMHYTPSGREVLDRSSVAIKFADSKPDVVIESWFPFRKRPDMVIPAGVEHHSLQDRYHFGSRTGGKAILLHGVRPHLHVRGKSYRLELIDVAAMTDRDLGKFEEHDKIRGEVLLRIPVWDFNWQHFYRFEKPILIRPNQAILATAYWDNSPQNPRNPDATANVPWGQQTEQEMFNTLFNYEVLEDDDPRLAEFTKQEQSRRDASNDLSSHMER